MAKLTQLLEQLLNTKDSELAKLLGFHLYAIKASLRQAQKEYPKDPAFSVCEEFLQDLDRLSSQQDSKQIQTNYQTDSLDGLKLKPLQDEFFADKKLFPYFGGQLYSQSQTDEQIWLEVQLLLLRVPENLAKSWQKRALETASQVGAKENKRSLKKLPFSSDEVIYPGLSGTVQTQGLSLSTKTNLDPRINPRKEDEDLYLLGGIVSTYIKLIDLESSLHHAFKPVFRFALKSLKDQSEREKYINKLIDCFHRYQEAEEKQDIRKSLYTWLDLDEAIHSLVFNPPAHPNSWWGKLKQKSRVTLNNLVKRGKNAGHKVIIRPLNGVYADICRLSRDDIELDSGGNPGEVLTCLRVYARIDGEEIPGRVLYRSLKNN